MSECQNCCSKPCECAGAPPKRDPYVELRAELAALKAELDGVKWEKEQIRTFAAELRRLASAYLEIDHDRTADLRDIGAARGALRRALAQGGTV